VRYFVLINQNKIDQSIGLETSRLWARIRLVSVFAGYVSIDSRRQPALPSGYMSHLLSVSMLNNSIPMVYGSVHKRTIKQDLGTELLRLGNSLNKQLLKTLVIRSHGLAGILSSGSVHMYVFMRPPDNWGFSKITLLATSHIRPLATSGCSDQMTLSSFSINKRH